MMLHYPTVGEFEGVEDDFAVYSDLDGETFYRDSDGTVFTSDEVSECDDCTTLCEEFRCESCEDEYVSCYDCGDTVKSDDTTTVSGESICDAGCLSNYYSCYDCSTYVHGDDTRWASGDTIICERCCDHNYSYCDACDEYEHMDLQCQNDCSCEAHAQRFTMPNGTERVENDESVTLSTPAGFVSDEGMGEIARLIRAAAPPIDYNAIGAEFSEMHEVAQKWFRISYSFADAIGSEWQTKGGNFTKRLSRFAYQSEGIKLSPALISQIGNVGSQHSQGSTFDVEFTRDLNLSAEEFGHEDSCWWQSYSSSRCALKSNGGIGMRTFGTVEHDEYDYQIGPWSHHFGSAYVPTGNKASSRVVSGRAWVMPLRFVDGSLRPTIDTESPDAYVVFNGYGNLSGYAPARLLAQMTGMTYRKTGLSADPMYVNSNAGYLVGPESLVERFDGTTIYLNTPQHANLATREHANA